VRIYDMRCIHELCGRAFDWHTKPAVYNRSSSDAFRDVRCWWCGRLGAKRSLSATPDLTVKGTWSKHASPELKGKSYYGKQEHARQAALTGHTIAESGDSHGTAKAQGDSPQKKRDENREAIETLLVEKGAMRLKDIIGATGLSDRAVHDVVYKDPGRIRKTARGIYGVTGGDAQTPAAS